MRYLYTTLAVGKEYVENSISSYEKMSSILSCDFNITTNQDIIHKNKFNVDYFSLDRYHDDKPGFSFYLNLKALSLKYALDKGYDYVIYSDADWRPTSSLTEQKIHTLFQYMEDNEYDMLFERPAQIGYYKKNVDQCFFTEKLRDYNVFEHTKWDEAHVTNEQFLVFRVNWKYRFFVRRWEQYLWYTIANNIRSYPDGFEIGVSALESDMRTDYDNWRYLVQGCFEFNDKQGNTHIRF